MARKQQDLATWALVIVGVIAIYGASQGWFSNGTPNTDKNVTPDTSKPIMNSCSALCSAYGFSQSYDFITSCRAGEYKFTYGYPGDTPLLTCCCYNTVQQNISACSETDGGMIGTTPGTTTYNGLGYTDYCKSDTSVYEYYCDGNTMKTVVLPCNTGQTCKASRSGGYCYSRSWSPGDTVFSGGGSGSVAGGGLGYAEIDLSDYGLETGGHCQLGATLSVDWSYGNDKCVGIMGTQGMLWQFLDSSGLEYERLDTIPSSWSVDLHPKGHILYWDGHTPWRAIAKQSPGNSPDCIINYQYTARVYIYDCL